MKNIVLATGIYPPAIGGPATYVRALAQELRSMGNIVTVISYGRAFDKEYRTSDPWSVVWVFQWGGPLLRWMRYARALRRHAFGADAIIAFSSVSIGFPLLLARLKKPVKILRLGGDFFWERYTDMGGTMNLREWYADHSFVARCSLLVTRSILRAFDSLVFSTQYEEEIYKKHYLHLPVHCVIENAFPRHAGMTQSMHLVRTGEMRGDHLRLLYLGRFVGFKNLPSLVRAVFLLKEKKAPCELKQKITLTLVGSGPLRHTLVNLVEALGMQKYIKILPPAFGAEKAQIFAEHDLLVIPSLTEISPNAALEARAAGLPVLLTQETGLSQALTHGMLIRPLRTPEEICTALTEAERSYAALAKDAMAEIPKRTYGDITEEFLRIVSSP